MQPLELFHSKRGIYFFLLACGVIFAYSILIHYNNYLNLTRYDTYDTEAKVLLQYSKTKDDRTYQVLKLQTKEGLKFYTTKSKTYRNRDKTTIGIRFWTSKITFYGYLTSFYAYSHFYEEKELDSLKNTLNQKLDSLHPNENIAAIYKALYTAEKMPHELQTTLSTLGISHLLAISGFHLGVLSAVLFFLLRPLYRFFQKRYFPFSHANRDTFLIAACILLGYMLFLDVPPSLLRAFGMLVVGFILHDRGYKIVSMQTLFATVLLLLSLFPTLFFALGFWLSSLGVFYIFLFLIYFKSKSKLWQFVVLPFWVYVMMVPVTLFVFGNFSLYHPLSILWTTLFTLFYPLSIVLHLLGFGSIFDGLLEMLLDLGKEAEMILLSGWIFAIHLALSMWSVYSKKALYALMLFTCIILSYVLFECI
ncbi:MAG: ComEC/Rec2 family competence protein [Sulfurimonadaceae bacterium]|jgi:competence protein ComEC|nr:ComEC/Rec2 family competence protein [Sulfurimonadaceae bacterium]